MNEMQTFALGLASGIGLMYVLDPDRGTRRRAMLRDQAVHLQHQAIDAAETIGHDMQHRMEGARATAVSRFHPGDTSDPAVQARVRTCLGRAVSHPGAINVMVEQGNVTLTGPVLEHEVSGLLKAVGRVDGVAHVTDRLERHATAGTVAGLQGKTRPRGGQMEYMQENWSPAARALAAAAGGGLAISGARRGDVIGMLAAAAGAALVARAATNMDLPSIAGMNGRSPGILIDKAINIKAPVEEVYDFWTRIDAFPRFMSHVREIEAEGNDTYRWVVDGPGGVPVEWRARVTERVPNEKVAWESLPGATVAQSGFVRFDRNPDGSTRLSVRMTYRPPAGLVGHTVASLLGRDPKHEFDDDLLRLQSLIEHGRTTAHGSTVTREAVRQL